MRTRGLMMAGVLCGMLLCAVVHATNAGNYQMIRSSLSVTRINDTAKFLKELSRQIGQIVEIDGSVSGIIANNNGSGFLLRTAGGQMILFSQRADDADIDIGVDMRVLARVPMGNTMLECVAATPMDVDLAVSPAALPPTDQPDNGDLGISDDADRVSKVIGGLRVIERPPQFYYKAPDLPNTAPSPSPDNLTTNEMVRIYGDRIRCCNTRIGDDTAQKVAFHLLNKCQLYGVDPRLMFALVAQESRFNPTAVSSAGARGLGQLMPGTAASLGVRDSFDIEDNLDGAVRYLAEQLHDFGRLSLALAAYNAGPGSVKKYNGVPPYHQTRDYIRRIWNHYATLVGLNPATGEPVQ